MTTPLSTPQSEAEMCALLEASIKLVKLRRSKRDEFSCVCCGEFVDGTICEACDVYECGERTAEEIDRDGCLVPKHVCVWRARHAAHYTGGGGHDLLTLEVTVPLDKQASSAEMFDKRGVPRVLGLPQGFEYHSGHREPDGTQRWRFVRKAPLSPGRCATCRPATHHHEPDDDGSCAQCVREVRP